MSLNQNVFRVLLIVVAYAAGSSGCAVRYERPDFSVPSESTPAQYSADSLECEFVARRAVPEMRMPMPAPRSSSAGGGFFGGLAAGGGISPRLAGFSVLARSKSTSS